MPEKSLLRRLIEYVALALFAVATVWINYEIKLNVQGGHSSGSQKEMGNVKVGEMAPDFSAMDLDGKKISLSSYRGQKVVLLDFWATWCPPCRMAMVDLQSILDKEKGKGLEILSLDQGETAEPVRAFIKRKNYGFHVLLDSDQAVAAHYGVRGIPTLVLIDKKGVVQRLQVGYGRDEAVLQNAIENLLAK